MVWLCPSEMYTNKGREDWLRFWFDWLTAGIDSTSGVGKKKGFLFASLTLTILALVHSYRDFNNSSVFIVHVEEQGGSCDFPETWKEARGNRSCLASCFLLGYKPSVLPHRVRLLQLCGRQQEGSSSGWCWEVGNLQKNQNTLNGHIHEYTKFSIWQKCIKCRRSSWCLSEELLRYVSVRTGSKKPPSTYQRE